MERKKPVWYFDESPEFMGDYWPEDGGNDPLQLPENVSLCSYGGGPSFDETGWALELPREQLQDLVDSGRVRTFIDSKHGWVSVSAADIASISPPIEPRKRARISWAKRMR